MKKLLTILFALCIVLSVTACNISDDTPQKEINNGNMSNVSSQEEEDKNFGLNDTATFKNLKVTAIKLEESNGKDYFKAESGKRKSFCWCKF